MTTVLGGFSDRNQLEAALDWMAEPPLNHGELKAIRERWDANLELLTARED